MDTILPAFGIIGFVFMLLLVIATILMPLYVIAINSKMREAVKALKAIEIATKLRR